MEQTFTSHLFSQALSSKEQRLAFKAPEAPKKSPEVSPDPQPQAEAKVRADQLARRLPEGRERQQQSWKNLRAVLEKSFGAPSTVQGDSAHSIVLMFEEAGKYQCPVYMEDGSLYDRFQPVFGSKPLLTHFSALLLVDPAVAIDTLSKVNSESMRPEVRVFIEAISSATKKDMDVVAGDIPVTPLTPVSPKPKPELTKPESPTPEPAKPEAPSAKPDAKPDAPTAKPDAVPEVSIEDYKSDIEGLNKETDAQKFKEKLEALNKTIDQKMKDKNPVEKAKLLERVQKEIKNEKFRVKFDQKLVIDEQQTPDVKPPTLDQKESMQSFVKDIIEAIKTFMKEFGLTKEDVKGIITNKPNAPTTPTAGLNAGNATAEQLTQAKVADAQRLAELEKRVKSLETDKNTPRGRAERTPGLDRLALEREVRERLEQRRLDRELNRRLELERRAQELADRTSREGQRYGIGAQVTLDRAGIRMYSVNDRGASTLRTIEQMAPQTLPGRLVHANDGSLIVPFIFAPRNSGNINVGGIQQNFEPSLASAYEKASSATPPSAPAPRVETPPAPRAPSTRRTPASGSLE